MLYRALLALASACWLTAGLQAGLHYSGETLAELPAGWRGFLLDQRNLRQIAAVPKAGDIPGPWREEYLKAAGLLEAKAKKEKLTADELADLGALQIRLGQVAAAVELLRTAQREHPNHFRIAANLGTAWQLAGNLEQSALSLEEAVRLAPGKHQKVEELHLKLVRQRLREPKNSQGLDDLFGITYQAEDGKYQAGKLAATEAKKLPASAVAQLQQLTMSLPADGRLLWQLGELAAVHGDIPTAAAMLEGCVTEFALSAAELRAHRQALRTVADAMAADPASAKALHEAHALPFKARSRRPLVSKFRTDDLPPITAQGVNAVPWALLNDTQLDRQFRPTFPDYLKDLDGKQVSLTGFMQPIGDGLEVSSFMLVEYPVGCWYCEVPEITGIVLVELPAGKAAPITRNLVKATGTLTLNSTDPERFIFTLGKASVGGAD